jgi:hypothetical protein
MRETIRKSSDLEPEELRQGNKYNAHDDKRRGRKKNYQPIAGQHPLPRIDLQQTQPSALHPALLTAFVTPCSNVVELPVSRLSSGVESQWSFLRNSPF